MSYFTYLKRFGLAATLGTSIFLPNHSDARGANDRSSGNNMHAPKPDYKLVDGNYYIPVHSWNYDGYATYTTNGIIVSEAVFPDNFRSVSRIDLSNSPDNNSKEVDITVKAFSIDGQQNLNKTNIQNEAFSDLRGFNSIARSYYHEITGNNAATPNPNASVFVSIKNSSIDSPLTDQQALQITDNMNHLTDELANAQQQAGLLNIGLRDANDANLVLSNQLYRANIRIANFEKTHTNDMSMIASSSLAQTNSILTTQHQEDLSTIEKLNEQIKIYKATETVYNYNAQQDHEDLAATRDEVKKLISITSRLTEQLPAKFGSPEPAKLNSSANKPSSEHVLAGSKSTNETASILLPATATTDTKISASSSVNLPSNNIGKKDLLNLAMSAAVAGLVSVSLYGKAFSNWPKYLALSIRESIKNRLMKAEIARTRIIQRFSNFGHSIFGMKKVTGNTSETLAIDNREVLSPRSETTSKNAFNNSAVIDIEAIQQSSSRQALTMPVTTMTTASTMPLPTIVDTPGITSTGTNSIMLQSFAYTIEPVTIWSATTGLPIGEDTIASKFKAAKKLVAQHRKNLNEQSLTEMKSGLQALKESLADMSKIDAKQFLDAARYITNREKEFLKTTNYDLLERIVGNHSNLSLQDPEAARLSANYVLRAANGVDGKALRAKARQLQKADSVNCNRGAAMKIFPGRSTTLAA